jgi:predicted MFS family arabinose efflux permease
MRLDMPAPTAGQETIPAINERHRLGALGLLAAAFMLSTVDRMILSVLFEPIKAEFQLSDTQLGLLGGLTFGVFYALMGIPLAKYADRNDRRPLIVVCLLLFSVMTALSGLAAGFLTLALCRILVAVGEAGVNPASQSIIADYYPRNRRSFAMSAVVTGGNIGMVVGFLVAGYVSQHYGWRAAFFAVGVPGILLAIAFFLFFKEPKRGQADSHLEVKPSSRVTVRQAVTTMLTTPVLRQLLFGFTISGMLMYSILQWLPAYFGRVHELPQGRIGVIMALFFGVFGAIGTLVGGRLTDVLNRRRDDLGIRMIAISQAVAAPLLIIGYMSMSLWVSLAFLMLPMLVFTFYLGPSQALLQTYAPAEMRSMVAALKMLAVNLIGVSIGPLLVGIISDRLAPTAGPRSLAIALSLITLFSFWSATHYWLAGREMLKLQAKNRN